MINAVTDTGKPIFKRTRKYWLPSANEVPNHPYFVTINNNMQQNQQPRVNNKQEIDKEITPPLMGLPPQPKEYLKYPDCDWF